MGAETNLSGFSDELSRVPQAGAMCVNCAVLWLARRWNDHGRSVAYSQLLERAARIRAASTSGMLGRRKSRTRGSGADEGLRPTLSIRDEHWRPHTGNLGSYSNTQTGLFESDSPVECVISPVVRISQLVARELSAISLQGMGEI